MSTHNPCFRAKIRKNVYPCTPPFYYIKVGCEGLYIPRTCLHDAQFIAQSFEQYDLSTGFDLLYCCTILV